MVMAIIMEVGSKQLRIDNNVLSAWENWVTMGLHPGSFAMAVLLNDRVSANQCAHTFFNVNDHFDWCDDWMPLIMRSETWSGWTTSTDEERLMAKLQCPEDSLVRKWIKWMDVAISERDKVEKVIMDSIST